MTTPHEKVIRDRLLKAVANQRALRLAVATAPGDIGEGEEPEPIDSSRNILEELGIDDSPGVEGIG